jgi:hypothetical protein
MQNSEMGAERLLADKVNCLGVEVVPTQNKHLKVWTALYSENTIISARQVENKSGPW